MKQMVGSTRSRDNADVGGPRWGVGLRRPASADARIRPSAHLDGGHSIHSRRFLQWLYGDMSVGGGAALAAHGAEAPLTAKAIMRQSGRAFLRTPPSQQLPSAASARVHRSAIGSAEHYERRENFRHGGGIPNYFFFLQPVTDGMRKCPNALRAAAPVAAAP